MKRIAAGLLIALVSLDPEESFAQEKAALRVLVEGVGSEAVNCGIRKSAIEQVVARSLKSHGIALSKDEGHPYLYVNVNAYRVMQDQVPVGCTTRLGVSVRAHPVPEPAVRGFRSKSGTYVVLCEAGRLLSGAQREVAAAVTKTLEEDIKNCLSQLSY
jgi:hypothetical protein